MFREKSISLGDGDAAVIKIADPTPPIAVPAEPDASAWPAPPRGERRPQPVLLPWYDLGSYLELHATGDSWYAEWKETPLEASPSPTKYQIAFNNDTLLQQIRIGMRQLPNGAGEIHNCYQLQTDSQTPRTNLVATVAGPRGSAYGAATSATTSWWVGPSPTDAQRDTIRRLRAANPNLQWDAFRKWEQLLDERDRRQWGNETVGRVGHEAAFRLRTAPQSAFLSATSTHLEHFHVGDRHRYMCTFGDTPSAAEIEPRALRINRRCASHLDVFHAPQLQDVSFMWFDLYTIRVGWWFTIIAFPNIKRFTLRTAFWPAIWEQIGIPNPLEAPVGIQMSRRIPRTRAYALALLQRTNIGEFYEFVGSILGRYKIRQAPLYDSALCAVLRHRWPNGSEELVRVFRRPEARIARPNDLLECSGLYTQEVTPWTPSYYINTHLSSGAWIVDGF